MANYISQTFSVKSLILLDFNAKVKVTQINKNEIPKDCISAIGHDPNTIIINRLLNTNYETDRKEIHLTEDDTLYIVLSIKTLDMRGAKRIPLNKLKNTVRFLKVNIEGFKSEARLNKRLIRAATNYLSQNFTFKLLGRINYEAELIVKKVSVSEIPKKEINAFIINDKLRDLISNDLGINVDKKYTRWFINDGDTYYVAMSDVIRFPEGGKNLNKSWYEENITFIKIEVHGIQNIEVEVKE